jgi:hypothetical protein
LTFPTSVEMSRTFRTPWSQRATSATEAETTTPSTPKAVKDLLGNEKNTNAAADMAAFEKSHHWDPNLPQAEIDILHRAAKTGDAEAVREVEEVFAEDSPYEEVRAAVRNTDEGGVANTVRAWVLGMVFVTIGAGLNMFLSMRFVICCLRAEWKVLMISGLEIRLLIFQGWLCSCESDESQSIAMWLTF